VAKVAKSGKRAESHAEPILQASDFRTYLQEKAAIIAPGDVETALSSVAEARRMAAEAARRHPLIERQVDVALRILEDHAAGRCRQVPYRTVALLTVAVFYLLNPNDVIPDFIPRVGTSDDALVFELAFEMAAAGVERYCIANDLPTQDLFASSLGSEGRA
jgi:uncharacterized membrane protein YkvA (DUF1232 family)